MSRRELLALAAVLLVGAALRGAYLWEVRATPDFAWPIADAAYHDYWARAVVSGDWEPPGDARDPEIRTTPYARPPGYTYFLIAVYWLTGSSYLAARVAQMVLGLASCVLAYALARSLLGHVAGLIAAALLATHWAFIYYEGELQEPFLLVFLALLLVLVLRQWTIRPALWRAALAGVLLGVFALVRSNILLFVPVAVLWAGWVLWRRGEGRRVLGAAAALVAGTVAMIAPVTIRNYVVARDFVLIASNGAINLYIGNNELADGVTPRIPGLQRLTGGGGWGWFTYRRIVQGVAAELGRPVKDSEASAYFRQKAFDYVRRKPGHCLALALRRVGLLLGPVEVTNNKVVHFDRAASPTLRFLPGFPFALATAALGGLCWLVERRARSPATTRPVGPAPGGYETAVLMLLLVGVYFASFLPFLAAERFRVPLVPFLAIFGAGALRRLMDWWAARDWPRAGGGTLAGLVLFGLAQVRFVDYQPDRSVWHLDRAGAYAHAKRLNEAIAEYQAALALVPEYAEARHGLARVLDEADRLDEAIAAFRATVALTPDNADVHYNLARTLSRRGLAAEAEAEYRAALRLSPQHVDAYINLGGLLTEQKRLDEAVAAFRRALELAPRHPEAHYNLGNALLERQEFDAAIAAYDEVLRVKPRHTAALVNRGVARLRQGRHEEALAIYRQALQLDPRHYEAHYNLGTTLAVMGRYQEALPALEAAVRLRPGNQAAIAALQAVRERLSASSGP